MKKGLIIVYTGSGKGKTTAALGTAMRAIGQGLKVLMVQFIKGSWSYGELAAAALLGADRLKILPMGRGFVKVSKQKPDPSDLKLVEKAWDFAQKGILSAAYDIVILDEINYVIAYRMLDLNRVLETLRQKPEKVHVILTGRGAKRALIDEADLVTEMREVKHPYRRGVPAQPGIEY